MKNLDIENASEDDVTYIATQLIIFNASKVPFTQNPPFIPINKCIRINNEIVAGIVAQITCWDMVMVEVLWVDEKYRGKGYATILLEQVEQEAAKQNCSLIQLDTFDFQAKGFYEKAGYIIFGEIENSPKGHTHFYMSKKL